MAGYGVVPEKKDTKEKYDKKPVLLGPVQDRVVQVRQVHEAGARTSTGTRRPTRCATSTRTGSTSSSVSPRGLHQAAHGGLGRRPDRDRASPTRSTPPACRRCARTTRRQEALGLRVPALRRLHRTSTWTGSRTRRSAQASPTRCPRSRSSARLRRLRRRPARGQLRQPDAGGPRQPTDPYGKLKKPQGDVDEGQEAPEGGRQEGHEAHLRLPATRPSGRSSPSRPRTTWRRPASTSRRRTSSPTRTTTRSARSRTTTTSTTPRGVPTGRAPRPWFRRLFDGRQVQDGAANYSHLQRTRSRTRRWTASPRSRPEQGGQGVEKLADKILKEDVPAVPLHVLQGDPAVRVEGRRRRTSTTSLQRHQPDPLYVKK